MRTTAFGKLPSGARFRIRPSPIKYPPVTMLLALIPLVEARLGETPKEIEARYGKPISSAPHEKPATVANTYTASGFEIIVEFMGDKSVYERFQKPEILMSKGEIEVLLEANKGASSWKEVSPAEANTRKWEREDGGAVAFYDYRCSLNFFDQTYKRERAKIAEDEKKAKMKGF